MIQRRLGIAQNGRFDAATGRAVRDFQDDNDLVSDGIIGPRTFAYPDTGHRLAAANDRDNVRQRAHEPAINIRSMFFVASGNGVATRVPPTVSAATDRARR